MAVATKITFYFYFLNIKIIPSRAFPEQLAARASAPLACQVSTLMFSKCLKPV